MMFGRKKRERIIADWPSLQDALIGNFDAEETGTGAMQVKVEWKAEERSQAVTIAYAVAPEIGPIAYITAPIGSDLSADVVRRAMNESVKFLDGGIVIDRESLALRATLPFEEVPFSIISSEIHQIAANADEIAVILRDEGEVSGEVSGEGAGSDDDGVA
ncbi:MAG: hypothetical protein QM705_09145 [Ancrocorticia sp.]